MAHRTDADPTCGNEPRELSREECLEFRDRLRAARYAALADSEGFQEICYAVEALGMRMLGRQATLDKYLPKVRELAQNSALFANNGLSQSFPAHFTGFDALFETLRRARNDVMHGGSYARHAAAAAVELCIGLEEALMNSGQAKITVADYMVKTPMQVEPWQPVAYARHLMLAHSFSFLPLRLNGTWRLLSEMAVVAYLYPKARNDKDLALAKPLSTAVASGLACPEVSPVSPNKPVAELFHVETDLAMPALWLVVDEQQRLVGVLSPFELM